MKNLSRFMHPFLIAVYPALSLYAESVDEVRFGDVWPVLAVMLAIAAGVFLVCRLLTSNLQKAAVLTSMILALVLFHGFLVTFINDTPWLKHRYFFIAFAVIFLLLVSRRWSFEIANKVLNVVALAIVALPVAMIVSHGAMSRPDLPRDLWRDGLDQVELTAPEVLPNIYYLIFDRYGSARTLGKEYGFDNSQFLEALTERGFFVAGESNSNYLKTGQSLASSLNMGYLDGLSEAVGVSGDWHTFYELMADFRLHRLLRPLGYKYLHLGSWWEGSRVNRLADESFQSGPLNEFAQAYIATTLIPSLGRRHGFRYFNRHDFQCVRVPEKFDRLRASAKEKGPLFVFAHFLLPHDPFVFRADGSCQSEAESAARDPVRNYVDQVMYTNSQIVDLVDHLMRQSTVPPVIILQADEGPFPTEYKADPPAFDWTQANPDQLKLKSEILNAYYLPGRENTGLYPGVTPVNTFRLVLNRYFHAGLPILEDRVFAHPHEGDLYSFFDVTAMVRENVPGAAIQAK